MSGWPRSAGSGPATSTRSNATWIAWINQAQHSRPRRRPMTDRAPYDPGPAAGARVHKEGDRWTLILVRDLRHSPDKVWRALTDPAQLHEWAPFDADESLGAAGATVKLTTVGAPTPH